MKIKTEFPNEFYLEEDRTIKIDSEKKRLWAVLLDLLIEFDRVCKKNGIKYMIDGGTLLGAIRHGGFIPWDDDIDVIMLRDQYEKLNAIANKEFAEPYFWQTNITDPDHGRGYARLRNSTTTYIPRFEMDGKKPMFKHNQGALIDIFICDNVPDSKRERSSFLRCLSRLRAQAWAFRMSGHTPWRLGLMFRLPELSRMLVYKFLALIAGINVSQWLFKRLDSKARQYNGAVTEFVSHLTFSAEEGSRLCLFVPRCYFDALSEVEFEGHKFPATVHWDEYLTLIYGNWRKHVVSSNTPGGILVDLNRSYMEYIRA